MCEPDSMGCRFTINSLFIGIHDIELGISMIRNSDITHSAHLLISLIRIMNILYSN